MRRSPAAVPPPNPTSHHPVPSTHRSPRPSGRHQHHGHLRAHRNHRQATKLKFVGATILLFSSATFFFAAHFRILDDIRAQPSWTSSQTTTTKKNQSNKKNKTTTKKKTMLSKDTLVEKRTEITVFESIRQRAEWSLSQCHSLRDRSQPTMVEEAMTASGHPFLPEGGVSSAIQKWLRNPHSNKNQNHTIRTNSTVINFTNNNNVYNNNHANGNSDACSLPPSKSCHVETYTAILLSHNGDRFPKMAAASLFSKTRSWKGLTELIFVWNAPRSELERIARGDHYDNNNDYNNNNNYDNNNNNNTATSNETHSNSTNSNSTNSNSTSQIFARQLLQRHDDPSDPLRIFYSLEHGLTDDLLNRYHPLLSPRNEALLYFDDDGPFSSFPFRSVMKPALELWKRHSDVQIGGRPRHLSFSSSSSSSSRRLETALHRQRESFTLPMAMDGHPNPSPTSSSSSREFIPFCRDTHRERAVYHPHLFPDFDARILLPTGSILHRNYLCFLWHDALEELREYVRRHVTRPDDVYVSVLVAQLAGKGARTFGRKRTNKKTKRGMEFSDGTNRTDDGSPIGNYDNSHATGIQIDNDNDDKREYNNDNHASNEHNINNSTHRTGLNPNAANHNNNNYNNNNNIYNHYTDDPQRHRRLLWETPDWFTYREEAVNSILGYFGSIHPGSVGWCAGTPYMKKYALDGTRRDDHGNSSSSGTNTTLESMTSLLSTSSSYALPSIGYYCEPEYPPLEYIPWMNDWGVGYRQCP